MRKIFIPLLLAQLLLAPVLTSAQLTEAEQAFAQKCRDNVEPEKKQLSAAIALECVKRLNADNAALLNKLRDEDPETGEILVVILSRNNALLDLKNIATNETGQDLLLHLSRVFRGGSCALCDMNLGPKPEKTFEWVGKEAGSRLYDFKKTVRTWDALGDIRIKSLSSADYGYDRKRWNTLEVSARYQALSDWAVKETDAVTAVYGSSLNRKPDPHLMAALREDLEAGGKFSYLLKLQKLENDLSRMRDEKKSDAPSPEGKKDRELAGAARTAAGLKNRPEAEQAAYLSETFDQAGYHKDGVKPDEPVKSKTAEKPDGFVSRKLTPHEVAGMSGRLLTQDTKGNLRGPVADEIRGTRAGDEILAFYKDPQYAKTGTNRLNFSFSKQPKGQFGGWSASARTLNLNSELVNNWMEKRKVAPEQLFEGDPSKNTHLRELAQYLAPTFVHEATHQRQFAKAAAGGINFQMFYGTNRAPYHMESETEAFSMDSSFAAEKLQKQGPAYAAKLDPFDKYTAALFIEQGVEGIRLENHRKYTNLDSFEGSAAKEFKKAASLARELNGLETRYKAAPGALEPEEDARMRELRAAMNSRFKWYTIIYADSAANEAKINGWREEIKSKLYPSKFLDSAAPPELL